MSFIVAIDGPAGSGKGTVTKLVAEKLGFIYQSINYFLARLSFG